MIVYTNGVDISCPRGSVKAWREKPLPGGMHGKPCSGERSRRADVTENGRVRDPLFSVVIPTHARPHQLADCLNALARQQFPRGAFEVIVVDDGDLLPSQGPAPRDLDVKVVRQPHAGPAAARNRGVAHACGQYLAFVDDDCVPDPGWLAALERCLRRHPGALVGGRVINALNDNPWSTASQLLIDFLYDSYTDGGAPRFFCTNNLALARDAFQNLGGFDRSFRLAAGEDRDFCARWTIAGGVRIYTEEAIVYHLNARRAATFCRQHFECGRGAHYFRRRLEPGEGARVRLEPPGFYMRLLRYPFRAPIGGLENRLAMAALFAVSQLLTGVGFCTQALRPHRAVPLSRDSPEARCLAKSRSTEGR